MQRKTVVTPTGQDAAELRAKLHSLLVTATEECARELEITGFSFVTSSMGIWMAELAELDARATAQFLHALADIADPGTNTTKKAHAEKRRAAAVRELSAALDLDMAKPEGTA